MATKLASMMIIGPVESPRPLSAPASTWFTQLNIKKYTFIRINREPKAITFSSAVKSLVTADEKIQISDAITNVIPIDRRTEILVPSLDLLIFPAPIFWLTKVVDAIAMLFIGSSMN